MRKRMTIFLLALVCVAAVPAVAPVEAFACGSTIICAK